MDALLIGGSKHGEKVWVEPMDEELYPAVLMVASADNHEEAKIWGGLVAIGIQPPLGAHVELYLAWQAYIDPLIYIFAYSEGDEQDIQAED